MNKIIIGLGVLLAAMLIAPYAFAITTEQCVTNPVTGVTTCYTRSW